MKSILKICVTLILLISMNAVAQAQSNVIKINIFSPIVRTLNMQYERKITSNGSFQLGFYYTGYSVENTKFSGLGITPEYRFYLSNMDAPQGVYVAPFLRYQSFTLSKGNDKGTLTTMGGGLILGKQWIFKEKIALDIFLGPSYSSGDVKVTSGADSFNINAFSGFGLRTGVCFGFAF